MKEAGEGILGREAGGHRGSEMGQDTHIWEKGNIFGCDWSKVMEMRPESSTGASPRGAGSQGVWIWFRRQWESLMAPEQGADVICSWFQKGKVGWRWASVRQLGWRC